MMSALHVLFVLAAQASPQASASCKLAVLDAEHSALTPDEIAQVAAIPESLAIRASDRTSCTVITPADVRRLVEFETGRQACGAEGSSCIGEIGTALGVDRLLVPSVARVGSELVVRVTLLDTKRSNAIARTERTVRVVDEIRAASLSATDEVLAKAYRLTDESTALSMSTVGIGVGIAGGVLAVAGGFAAVLAEGTLGDLNANTTAKDTAYVLGIGGVIASSLGVAGAITGGVLVMTSPE